MKHKFNFKSTRNIFMCEGLISRPAQGHVFTGQTKTVNRRVLDALTSFSAHFRAFVFAEGLCRWKRVAGHKSLPTDTAGKVRRLPPYFFGRAFGNCCTQHVDKFLEIVRQGRERRMERDSELTGEIRQLVTQPAESQDSLHTFAGCLAEMQGVQLLKDLLWPLPLCGGGLVFVFSLWCSRV